MPTEPHAVAALRADHDNGLHDYPRRMSGEPSCPACAERPATEVAPAHRTVINVQQAGRTIE